MENEKNYFFEKKLNSILMSRSLQETLAMIDDLNLDCIQTKLCLPINAGGYAWPEEGAKKAIIAYKGYLKLIAENRYLATQQNKKPESLPIQSVDKTLPPGIVDIAWHTHILFTRKYFKDCKKIFGFYLHHAPNVEET